MYTCLSSLALPPSVTPPPQAPYIYLYICIYIALGHDHLRGCLSLAYANVC